MTVPPTRYSFAARVLAAVHTRWQGRARLRHIPAPAALAALLTRARLRHIPAPAALAGALLTRARLRRIPAPAALAGRLIGLLAVAATGAVIGILLAGRVSNDVGPFQADLAVRPALHGGTEVAIPPLGSLHLDSHAGPAELTVRLESLDQQRTTALVTDPSRLDAASATAVEDLDRGLRRLIFQVLGVSVLGAMALGAVAYRSMRRVAECGGLALLVVASTGVVALTTFRADSIEEPRYEGLLTNAPAVVGDARRIAGRYAEYRAELQRLVQNVGRLYGAVSTLPVYEPDGSTIRVLHVSDMHLNPAAWGVVSTVVDQFGIDLVVDTGDITDWGSEPEASYTASIAALGVPYVYVRGNHDSARTAAAVARQPNATVLDNGTVTIKGLTIAGIGDPRFTPDKSAGGNDPDAGESIRDLLRSTGEQLAETIDGQATRPDIALVHDPAAAGPIAGHCPLVLAGHTHQRDARRLDADGAELDGPDRTLLMIEGSTGGAGLRGLERKEPLPLALSVLYFDRSRALQAYDDISVGGTGQTEVTLQRHVVRPDDEKRASPTPSLSGTGSTSAPAAGSLPGPAVPSPSPS